MSSSKQSIPKKNHHSTALSMSRSQPKLPLPIAINRYARISAPLGIAVLYGSVIYGMHRVGLGFIGDRPISYLGVDHRSQLTFNSGLIISALLFSLFGLWLRSRYRTGRGFLYFLLIGQLCQVVTALSIDIGPTKRLHTVTAFCIVISLPFLMRSFAVAQTNAPFRRQCQRFVYVELLAFVIGIGLFTLTKGVAPLGEAIPAVGFDAWMVFLMVASTNRSNR